MVIHRVHHDDVADHDDDDDVTNDLKTTKYRNE